MAVNEFHFMKKVLYDECQRDERVVANEIYNWKESRTIGFTHSRQRNQYETTRFLKDSICC